MSPGYDDVESRGDGGQASMPWGWAVAGLLLLTVALVARSWRTILELAFHVEDTLLFSQYYGAVQPLADVTSSHFGQTYVTLVSNLFAWLYAWVDVRLQPYLYQWTGFVFGVAASCCLFVSGLFRNRTVLLVGPLLIGLTAMNHIYYYNSLIYVMYTAIILLLALMIMAVRMRGPAVMLLLPFLVLFSWAGPYSVLALPVGLALLLLYRMPNLNRFVIIAVMMSTVFYFLTVKGDTTQLSHITKLGIIGFYLRTLLEQVVFLGQFDRLSAWWWLAPAALIVGSFLLFRRDRYFIRHSLVFFGIIVASLALFFLSIKFPLYRTSSACHRLISLYFWCVFLLYVIDRCCVYYGGGRRSGVVIAALLLALIVVDNQRYPRKRWVRVPLGIEDFVSDVHKVEQLPLKESNEYVILRMDNLNMKFFRSTARVGSRAENARQLGSKDLSEQYRSRFIVEP